MAQQTDLGKGVLISGIVAGVLAIGLTFILPDAPEKEKLNFGAGSTDHITAQVATGKKITGEIGLAKNGKKIDQMAKHAVKDASPATKVKSQHQAAEKQLRVSPLFETPELWQVAIPAEKKNVVADIYAEGAPQIHEGISNSWFKKYGLDEAMCVSNGATLDSDDDGFSNKEEEQNGTSPIDKTSAPALHGSNYVKLATVSKTESSAYVQLDSNELEYVDTAEFVTIKVFAKKGDSQPIKALTKEVKEGESFGVSEAEPNRYKLVKIKTGSEGGITAVDTANPKKGEEKGFFIGHGKKNRKKVADTKITLKTTAGAKKGESFEVLLGATFSLPGEESTKCRVVNTNDDGSSQIVIEGNQSEVTAPKAEN